MGEIINGGNVTWLAKPLEVVLCRAWLVAQGISCPEHALHTQWYVFQSHPAYKTRRWLIWLLSRVQCFAASRFYSDSPALCTEAKEVVWQGVGDQRTGPHWPTRQSAGMAVLRCRAVQRASTVSQHCASSAVSWFCSSTSAFKVLLW